MQQIDDIGGVGATYCPTDMQGLVLGPVTFW